MCQVLLQHHQRIFLNWSAEAELFDKDECGFGDDVGEGGETDAYRVEVIRRRVVAEAEKGNLFFFFFFWKFENRARILLIFSRKKKVKKMKKNEIFFFENLIFQKLKGLATKPFFLFKKKIKWVDFLKNSF